MDDHALINQDQNEGALLYTKIQVKHYICIDK